MLALGLWCPSAPSLAQEGFGTPVAGQLDLVRQGVAASDEGDYAQAIRYYDAAMALGELNIIHLNLGRARQKQGRCFEAEASFARALGAPAVRKPSPTKVREAIESHREEMRSTCPGALTVQCIPLDARLIVGERAAGCGERLELPAGLVRIQGEAGGVRTERTVEVEALKEHSVLIEVEAHSDQGASTREVLGWSLVALGGALTVTGVGLGLRVAGINRELDAIAESNEIDGQSTEDLVSTGQSLQTLEFIGLGVGASAAAIGAVMLLLGEGEPDRTGALQIAPWVLPDGGGLTFGIRP